MAEFLGEPGPYKWTKLFSISINRAGAPATTRLLDLTFLLSLSSSPNNEITCNMLDFTEPSRESLTYSAPFYLNDITIPLFTGTMEHTREIWPVRKE